MTGINNLVIFLNHIFLGEFIL